MVRRQPAGSGSLTSPASPATITAAVASALPRRRRAPTPRGPGRTLVWLRWTDPRTWGEWDLGLRGAEVDGPFTAGRRGSVTGLGGRRWAFVIREVRDRELTVVDVRLPAAVMVRMRMLGPGSPATVEHRVTFEGPLAALWSAVLGRRFRPLIAETVDPVAGP